MAQLTLVAAKESAAELLGRVLDASLESRADGQPFKHWATLPLTSCVYEAPSDLDRRSTIPGAFAVGLKSPNLSFSSAMPFFAASKSDNVAANGGRLTIASSCASQNVCVHSWRACSCCVPRFSSLPQKLQGRLKSQIFKSGRFPQSQNRVCVRVSLRRCPGSLSVGPRAVRQMVPIFQSYRCKKALTPVTVARRYAAVAPQAGAAITRGAAAPARTNKVYKEWGGGAHAP